MLGPSNTLVIRQRSRQIETVIAPDQSQQCCNGFKLLLAFLQHGGYKAHTHLGGGSARQEVGSQAAQAAAAAAALSAQHACACTTWSHSGHDSSVAPAARALFQWAQVDKLLRCIALSANQAVSGGRACQK